MKKYFLTFLIFISFPSIAEKTTTSTLPGFVQNKAGLVDLIFTPLGWTIGMIVIVLITIVVEEILKSKLEKRITQSYLMPPKLTSESKKNAILLLGQGGTGKTTLIQHLFHDEDANPATQTEVCKVYEKSLKTKNENVDSGSGNSSQFHLFVADYKGQNVGTLVRGFIELQSSPNAPIKYKHVNSLIMVVDIFTPGEFHDDDIENAMNEKPDVARIESHLEQWNDTALDAVSGLLTDSVGLVCVFINKIDLLKSDYSLEEIERNFSPLIQRLRKRFPKPIRLEVIFGSAKKHIGIYEIEKMLRETGVQS